MEFFHRSYTMQIGNEEETDRLKTPEVDDPAGSDFCVK